MKTKLIRMIPALAAVMLAAGCSDASEEIPQNGPGQVTFACTASEQVNMSVTRAEQIQLPAEVIPSIGGFTLHVTGTYTGSTGELPYESRSTIDDWNAGQRMLEGNGTYTAEATHGDPETEGAGAEFAYFAGKKENFQIKANQQNQVEFTVRLANSCFKVVFSEWMTRYYTDIVLQIGTGDNTFEVTPETAGELVFVKVGQQLTMQGTAVKAQTGTAVTFPSTVLGGASKRTAAQTQHTISIDAGEAGAGALTISFDGSLVEVTPEDEELNPAL